MSVVSGGARQAVGAWLKSVWGAVLACVLVACACQEGLRSRAPGELPKQQSSSEEVPPVEWALELTGSGLGRPAVFTFEQLAGMEMRRLDKVLMQKTRGPDELTSWQGPSLADLLRAGRMKPGPMKLTLAAADGYEMDCRVEEMRSAIVALKDGEGRWLAERGGGCALRLVPPQQPGNYWIMNLRRITVEPLGGAESGE